MGFLKGRTVGDYHEIDKKTKFMNPLFFRLRSQAQVAEGAIGKNPGLTVLTHADAGNYTLAAPTATTEDGLEMILTAGTAYAHVVVATSLVEDGITGGAKTTMTFGAFLGASIHLIAYQGLWYVVAKNVVTIT